MVATKATVAVIANRGWVVWKFRERLIAHLRTSGYRVVVIAQTDGSFKDLEPIVDELVDLPMAQSTIDVAADLKTLYLYVLELRRIRPLVALTFTIKPNIFASLACRWLRIPVISNVTGLGSAAHQRGVGAWAVRALYSQAFRRARRVFCQNPDDMQALAGTGVLDASKATLLPGSGVDTRRYQSIQHMRDAAGLTYCMLARLLRDKGVVEFARAAERVKARIPTARFRLWGILDRTDPRCVSAAEIDDWVRRDVLVFNGEARDAIQAFADVDVVVLPSYYPEGVPRTLLEAASMCIPCITTDMPGCRAAVLHGVTGLLCAPRDVDSLVDAMLKIAALTPMERRSMGQRARERMVAEFDERIVLDAYLKEIQQLHGNESGTDDLRATLGGETRSG